MLESLYVKNLALIDELEVSFREGLNILTGETGAGKSIILGSINLALGQRAQKEMIRDGAEYALVELLFTLESERQTETVRSMDLPVEEDRILIQRKIQANRSSCRVNGETVSQKQLQELADCLLDIHGQQDTMYLRNRTRHLEILDHYCGRELEALLAELKPVHSEYGRIVREREEYSHDDAWQQREISLLEYEYREICDANLTLGEDDTLEMQYQRMKNARRLATAVGNAMECLGNDREDAAGTQVNRSLRELMPIHGLDAASDGIIDTVNEIDGMLSDVIHGMRDYLEGLEFAEEEFRQTEDRLNLINHLKDKYGGSMEHILQYAAQCEEKLDRLHHMDAYRLQLEQRQQEWKAKMDEICSRITAVRTTYAGRLAQELENSLSGMNFLSVQCEVRLERTEEAGTRGWDNACFYISLNPGEKLRPLDEIASGGELSRIMLGLKTILADQDPCKTLIFDEIDAGISGRTAWNVAEKMGILARNHQMICITHLAQIAAMADHHYEIRKQVKCGVTTTGIKELTEDACIEEIGRLLGSDNVTDTVRKNATELREQARNVKTYHSGKL